MPGLFTPYRIKGVEFRNRFVRSATHDGTADPQGRVTAATVALYRGLAEGGVGLIISGGSPVSPEGQAGMPLECSVYSDEMIPGLRRLVEVAHSAEARIALQLGHAGIVSRYHARRGTPAPAPSRIDGDWPPHRAMTGEDVARVIAEFGAAAARAREAGFDAVQLHGAHGYLMSQFLSPLFNHRTDQWGGSPENRRRFLLEVVREVRRCVGPDYLILMKFGPLDDEAGGTTLEEGVATARQLAAAGLDALEISRGGPPRLRSRPRRPPTRPSALAEERARADRPRFRERAAAVKRAVTVPVMMVGGIRSLRAAQAIVDAGEADMISLSRPLIREPALVLRWQRGDLAPARCFSCNGCFWMIEHKGGVACYWEPHPA